MGDKAAVHPILLRMLIILIRDTDQIGFILLAKTTQ